MNPRFLTPTQLPHGFDYPPQFERLVRRGITDLEPWVVLEYDALVERWKGLNKRFPDAALIPFARREDNDDVACWSGTDSVTVHVVHDFSTNGWKNRATYPDFYAWLRDAVEAMIEYDQLED